MVQERQHAGLALMRAHYERKLDFEAVVDSFARKHSRRMEFGNILKDQICMIFTFDQVSYSWAYILYSVADLYACRHGNT